MGIEGVRTVDELQDMLDKGTKAKFVFFWGHTPKIPGRIDQSCLSNWFAASFEINGEVYRTAEHFMMAEKARIFRDPTRLTEILKAESPGKAKALGRMVEGFSEQVWEEQRFDIAVRATFAKFAQNKAVREFMLRTGNKVLVEASPQDPIWGIGLAVNDPRSCDPDQWEGLNLLGFALMEARSQLSARHSA